MDVHILELVGSSKGGSQMGTITKILSGTAVLVGLYLVLSKSGETVKVINSLGGVYTSGVKVLQGR